MNIRFDTSGHRYAFGMFDRVVIDGQAWCPVSSNEVGYVMTRPDEPGICHQFPHAQLSLMGASRRIMVEHDYFTAKAAQRRGVDTERMISLLTEKQQERLFARQIWTKAFLELEGKRQVQRTDDAIRASMGALTLKALKLAEALKGRNASHASAGFSFGRPPSPRSLRKWLKAFEADGLAGLADRAHQRGNPTPGLCHTGLGWMMREVCGYLHPDRPTIAAIFKRVEAAFESRNAEREAEGLPIVSLPSRETVRRAIRNLDPYQVELRRKGRDAARKMFKPVGRGLSLTRPLQRVEIDEWTVDILALLAGSGVLEWLSEEDREAFGLNGKAGRWTLTVAICATTRCILAMVMTPSAKATAAIQAIRMVISDKGALSTSVKAHGAWSMHGLPEEIVSDNGPAFKSRAFQTVCADLGMPALRTIAGVPEMRARIERVFRTMSINLMPELAGRSFSDVVEKGDANPADRACLDQNDLATILVRWVVDIYHNTEHDGLDGETPAQCWERLTRQFGVTPPPDTRTCRRIFGAKFTRKLDKGGLRVLGVQYHSPVLAAHFTRRRERELEIRWLPSDLGEIEVRIDNDWVTVPAVMEDMHGVRAPLWMDAVRNLRATDPERKRHDEKVVLAALRDIRALSEDAQTAMGLLVDDWSDDRLKNAEQKLMIGFEVGPAKAPRPREGGIGRAIGVDQHDEAAAQAPAKPTAGSGKYSLED
ncbi:Mu transposase C-terminal domain-containing protein [Paracoccus fistulariae]|uniref:DDE-type integrase/transposase/recombinase n=1 Tax=Paracoccus fistulariae TaxID=658446 RepID=A0ABY7SNP9_9RHOB|nr:DDE-type integrase/transposase/recombinase [Paracoccus fistulariae]MDB6180023.1 DDE-type integrase/transposase/recombinase [Paracoccus fistulariae]WCR08112.1 DDE-type integrase/transposase/recombinase [Paracoccus fistulariae]